MLLVHLSLVGAVVVLELVAAAVLVVVQAVAGLSADILQMAVLAGQ